MLGGLQRSSGAVYGLKVINAAMGNLQHGLERTGGVSFLFDSETARPQVIAEAGYLSAIRTAGYSMLSIAQLGPASWESVSVIGCGTQAATHVELLVGSFLEFRKLQISTSTWPGRSGSPTRPRSGTPLRVDVADTARDAVRSAPVIITVTTSMTPYIPTTWIEPGSFVAHVSLDDLMADVFRDAEALYVDDVDLVRDNPRRILGRLLQEGSVTSITGTLGMVLTGCCPTVRPSTGFVVQPVRHVHSRCGLIAAVYRQADLMHLGQVLQLQ